MKTNRIVAVLLAILMMLAMAMPVVALADEAIEIAAVEAAPVPMPEATAKVVSEGDADQKVAEVEAVAPVAPDAPAETPGEESGSSDVSGHGELADVQPVVPDIDNTPVITPPPASGDAPKPEAELGVASKDATGTFNVTFIYMSAEGVEQQSMVTVVSGGQAIAPEVPMSYTVVGGRTYNFRGWDSAYDNVTANTTVHAEYSEVTTITPEIDEYHLVNYAGKPGKTVAVQVPVTLFNANYPTAPVYSNAMLDGSLANKWSEKTTPDKFDQSICNTMRVNWMKVQVDTTSLSSMPFTTDSVTAANGKRRAPFIVQQFADDPAYYSKYGFSGGSANLGFARFDLKVKSGAKNGTYTIPLRVTWNDEEGEHKATFDAYVQITGEKSSGGGGGGGGGGVTPTEKPVNKARLYIESVRTDPESPKAGDAFKVILTLVNSSKTLYLQPVILQFSTAEDQLRPAGEGTNVIFIPKIAADAKKEVEIPVESAPDIANKLVKMTVQMDWEDKKLAADSQSQDVVIPVTPIQKMEVSDPKLPTGTAYVDQEYEIEIEVANTGKVVLNNLRADIVCDEEKVVKDDFYGGPLEGGTSKKISLSPVPLVDGDTEITVEISYENDIGEKTVVPKKITISATKEDDYGYDDSQIEEYTPPPEPEKVTPVSIMAVLPEELYVAAGALVLLIIASMAMSARKRRKRAMEDDEMD